MPVLGAIEISKGCDGRMPSIVIEQAYRLSRAGSVFLVLNGIIAQDVNRILDAVVPTMPLHIPGVLYIAMADTKKLHEVIDAAPAIYAASHVFRHFVAAHGYRRKLVDIRSFLALEPTEAHGFPQVTESA